MSDYCGCSGGREPEHYRGPLSIHTKKITDSCRDKDCIEGLRVYFTREDQTLLDKATSARARSAELITSYIDVEPASFDRNHYCVDVTFFYRVAVDAMACAVRLYTLNGLAVFTKRVVLCGEESRAHIYRSDVKIGEPDGMPDHIANLPAAVVEVLDPMILCSKLKNVCDCDCPCAQPVQIPCAIRKVFDGEMVLSGEQRRLYVTLGQFSIIRLERDVQLVIPVLDYSLPQKECRDCGGDSGEDPCEMFSRIPFPADQFSPRGCDGRNTGGCRNQSGKQPEKGCGCKKDGGYQTT